MKALKTVCEIEKALDLGSIGRHPKNLSATDKIDKLPAGVYFTEFLKIHPTDKADKFLVEIFESNGKRVTKALSEGDQSSYINIDNTGWVHIGGSVSSAPGAGGYTNDIIDNKDTKVLADAKAYTNSKVVHATDKVYGTLVAKLVGDKLYLRNDGKTL